MSALTSKSEKNPGRQFYACPKQREVCAFALHSGLDGRLWQQAAAYAVLKAWSLHCLAAGLHPLRVLPMVSTHAHSSRSSPSPVALQKFKLAMSCCHDSF